MVIRWDVVILICRVPIIQYLWRFTNFWITLANLWLLESFLLSWEKSLYHAQLWGDTGAQCELIPFLNQEENQLDAGGASCIISFCDACLFSQEISSVWQLLLTCTRRTASVHLWSQEGSVVPWQGHWRFVSLPFLLVPQSFSSVNECCVWSWSTFVCILLLLPFAIIILLLLPPPPLYASTLGCAIGHCPPPILPHAVNFTCVHILRAYLH